jgi:hypothetical protein
MLSIVPYPTRIKLATLAAVLVTMCAVNGPTVLIAYVAPGLPPATVENALIEILATWAEQLVAQCSAHTPYGTYGSIPKGVCGFAPLVGVCWWMTTGPGGGTLEPLPASARAGPASPMPNAARAPDTTVEKLNFVILKTPPAVENTQVDTAVPLGRMFTGRGRIAARN